MLSVLVGGVYTISSRGPDKDGVAVVGGPVQDGVAVVNEALDCMCPAIPNVKTRTSVTIKTEKRTSRASEVRSVGSIGEVGLGTMVEASLSLSLSQ